MINTTLIIKTTWGVYYLGGLVLGGRDDIYYYIIIYHANIYIYIYIYIYLFIHLNQPLLIGWPSPMWQIMISHDSILPELWRSLPCSKVFSILYSAKGTFFHRQSKTGKGITTLFHVERCSNVDICLCRWSLESVLVIFQVKHQHLRHTIWAHCGTHLECPTSAASTHHSRHRLRLAFFSMVPTAKKCWAEKAKATTLEVT